MPTYFQLAERDLQSAIAIMNTELFNSVVTLCVEACSKYLKHVLVKHIDLSDKGGRELQYHHDSNKILKILEIEYHDIFTIKDDVGYLETFYERTNYPENYIEVDKETAEKCIKACRNIRIVIIGLITTLER